MREDVGPGGGPAAWARDLVMGGRFALAGGRQGWVRTVLTAVGVGLGVVVLLFAASVPSMIHERDVREDARTSGGSAEPHRGPHTLLMDEASTAFHGKDINGRLIEAEGDDPVLPPGVERLPAPGEMVVSPALKELLDDDGSKELAGRLDSRVVGTIGDEGLLGPRELAFYRGADQLDPSEDAQRYAAFGGTVDEGPLDPLLLLLVVVACVVLVMPVAVFIGTAARFGGERRDQRLAALRLVGADTAMAHRMVAGESLVGAVLGLLLGGGLFLALRAAVGGITLFGLSSFPADVVPNGAVLAVILVGVPVLAVTVAQFAMRAIAVEPLGVVRESEPRPRRLWWRVAPPAVGALLLLPLAGTVVNGPGAAVNKPQVITGVVLLLGGVSLLLPWVVERLVGKLRGGFPSWQLAVRRLQIGSGSATRAVSGITIAVAGAVALQILFTGASSALSDSDRDGDGYMISGGTSTVGEAAALRRDLRHTEGVTDVAARIDVYGHVPGDEETSVPVSVGTCAMLRELATVGACRDGDVFLAPRAEPSVDTKIPKPGHDVSFAEGDGSTKPGAASNWRVPAGAKDVRGRQLSEDVPVEGVLATPGALSPERGDWPTLEGWVRTDPHDPEALERVRTVVYRADPGAYVSTSVDSADREFFEELQRAVLAAATGVLALIGLSLIVSMLEQLRERRRQLAVLVAFGTRRGTLGASVLWQTAIPVVLGLALAVAFGSALGWLLLRMLGRGVEHWFGFLPIVAGGVAVIAVVTLASLPPLWRMMRPDGLRTE